MPTGEKKPQAKLSQSPWGESEEARAKRRNL